MLFMSMVELTEQQTRETRGPRCSSLPHGINHPLRCAIDLIDSRSLLAFVFEILRSQLFHHQSFRLSSWMYILPRLTDFVRSRRIDSDRHRSHCLSLPIQQICACDTTREDAGRNASSPQHVVRSTPVRFDVVEWSRWCFEVVAQFCASHTHSCETENNS